MGRVNGIQWKISHSKNYTSVLIPRFIPTLPAPIPLHWFHDTLCAYLPGTARLA